MLSIEASTEGQFKNRSGLDIAASIIMAAMDGARKTHIMYKANLSHPQLQRYLNFLENNGLLKEIKDRSGKASIYEATERGMEFLKDYEQLESYLKPKGNPEKNSITAESASRYFYAVDPLQT